MYRRIKKLEAVKIVLTKLLLKFIIIDNYAILLKSSNSLIFKRKIYVQTH